VKFQKNKRKPDEEFLEWNKKQDCLCLYHGTQCIGDVVPAHIYAGGMSMKCDDKDTVPLCYAHHVSDIGLEQLSIHGFKEKYGIDVEEVAQNNYREFKNGRSEEI
jgi:hypothetical protein